MAKNRQDPYSKYIMFAVVLILGWISFLIIRPFVTAIFAGIIISYVFYPLHKQINKLIKNNTISALIASVLVVLIITLPLIFFLNAISKEAYITYITVKQKVLQGNLFGIDCKAEANPLCSMSNFFRGILTDPQSRYYIEDTLHKATSSVINNVSSFIFSLPVLLLNLFIILFLAFYLFRDGKTIFEKFKRLLPFKRAYQERIFKQFNDIIYAVIYGQLMVALIQGTLGGIGFFVLGLSSPILWGITMAFFALIPFIGPPIVWLPIALLQILTGLSQNDNSLVTKGILLILYGTLIVGTIDNILRPRIIGERAKIHPIMVLLGVVGGIKLYGIVGLVVGPIILAILMTIAKIYEERKLHHSLK